MSLVKKMKSLTHPIPWAGPCGDGLQGGVTQSMIGCYLCCKERFRILTIEGLKPHPRFSAPLDFGNMWHACEEALASGGNCDQALEKCVNEMMAQYPRDVEHILHWCSVAQELFPVYVDYWSEHSDVQNRTPLMAEQVFDVPYTLPSGRIVRLRGKWDSVDLVNGGPNAGIWNQDNKTKSSIDRAKITRQLTFDLQMMLYQVALEEYQKEKGDDDNKLSALHAPIRGIRYNVVRRSAHKTAASMMKKVGEDMGAGRSNEWFARLNISVSADDLRKFKQECLNPILENLCDDQEWWVFCKLMSKDIWDGKNRHKLYPEHFPRHFRYPFGVYNSVLEGGFGDVDSYMEDGGTAGLIHVTDLFPELSNEG